MKCPKCNYTSFDYLKECKKCGEILEENRRSLNLKIVEPTLFSNFYSNEQEKVNLTQVEPAFTGSSEPVKEQFENDFILDNEFSAPEKNELDTTPEVSPEQNNLTELMGLGSMDSIGSRTIPETDDFNKGTEIELDKPKTEPLDDLELTSSFASDQVAPETPETNELEVLEIDDLDLFTDLSDTSEIAPIDLDKDDIAFELNMDDPVIKDPEGVDSNKVNAVEDGSIELELDMDDDKSLDDLLADFDNNKS
ncbi:MAG TPA: hypothetical protein EYP64_07585 [Desulfarculaceae bacterium]|nr:hypothetical protein [Desulfarculaceae bacterium]